MDRGAWQGRVDRSIATAPGDGNMRDGSGRCWPARPIVRHPVTDYEVCDSLTAVGVSGRPRVRSVVPAAGLDRRSCCVPPSDDNRATGTKAIPRFERRPTVGIGITTFNRADMLRRTVEAVRAHTRHAHILFVADDGSTDGTVAMLEAMRVPHLAAPNRGIAWNKNRALFYLSQVHHCDVVILLEDDTYPNADGWERVWIEAAIRHGHINLYPSHWTEPNLGGTGTVDDPYVSRLLTGQCSAFARRSIDTAGFMDTRFRRYGYEHAEHTQRMICCGYGGLAGDEPGSLLSYLITSSLTVSGLDKAPDIEGITHNAPIFMQLRTEPQHRWAWRNDEEMAMFRCEQAAVVDHGRPYAFAPDPGPDWLVATHDGRNLLMDRMSPTMRAGTLSDRDVRVVVRVRGKTARVGALDVGQISWLRMNASDGFQGISDPDDASVFDFISAAEKGFGLRYRDFFLCCDMAQDGKVVLGRQRLSDWETFFFDGYALANQMSP